MSDTSTLVTLVSVAISGVSGFYAARTSRRSSDGDLIEKLQDKVDKIADKDEEILELKQQVQNLEHENELLKERLDRLEKISRKGGG